MTNARLLHVLFASLIVFVSQSVRATTVTYDVTNISGNTWEYNYSVANDSLSIEIEEFTIFFTVGDYENLAIGVTPANWGPLVIDPNTGIPDDGFYDALAFSIGIVPGASLGGFSVQFDYLGTGTPGSQLFDILNPNTFAVLDSGTTQLSAVPIPAAGLLMGTGLLTLFMAARRRDYQV